MLDKLEKTSDARELCTGGADEIREGQEQSWYSKGAAAIPVSRRSFRASIVAYRPTLSIDRLLDRSALRIDAVHIRKM